MYEYDSTKSSDMTSENLSPTVFRIWIRTESKIINAVNPRSPPRHCPRPSSCLHSPTTIPPRPPTPTIPPCPRPPPPTTCHCLPRLSPCSRPHPCPSHLLCPRPPLRPRPSPPPPQSLHPPPSSPPPSKIGHLAFFSS